MLYSVSPNVELTLDPVDGRYAVSFSAPTPAHPASDRRGAPSEPRLTPAYTQQPRAAAPTSQLTMEGKSHLKYPIPDMRELQPGVLSTGQWTVNHPLVDAYLAALARLAPKQKPHPAPRASAPSTAATSPVIPHPDTHSDLSIVSYPSQCEAEKLRWRSLHGGIASACTVAQVITVQYELFPGPGSAWYAAQIPRLSEERKQAIFALAALKVLNHPTHHAHWALWAKNVLQRTAQVVEAVFQLKPCPIVSHVGWVGLPESVWALQGLQSVFVPPPPQAEKPKAGGMTLRKRKTAAAAASAASTTSADGEATPRVGARKRQRTTRAQAALEQAQEDATASAAPASMLLDVPLPQPPAPNGAGAVGKAAKEELLVRDDSALQPLELTLALPDTAPAPAVSHEAPSPRSRSAASLSPSTTRRSTRTRRKPAQGPVTLTGSPASALSTPAVSPAPLTEGHGAKPEQARARSGSCGSSTAVSESGEASEGTVVDVDVSAGERATSESKGKRKAVEIEIEDVDVPAPKHMMDGTEAAPVENAQGAVPTVAKGGKKSRAKAGANPRPRKRVKIDESGAPQPVPLDAAVTLLPTAEVDVVPAPTLAAAPKKKAARPAKRKTAARKA